MMNFLKKLKNKIQKKEQLYLTVHKKIFFLNHWLPPNT